MIFPAAKKFLRQTGPLSADILNDCTDLGDAPSGFERVWAAFEPMDVMQKRGQIVRPQTGEAWQFVCDEGAALGGTDWAPPPLAYFGAGLTSSVAGALADKASELNVSAEAISVALDNYYSLNGSILLGTMEGKGHNPDINVAIQGAALSKEKKSSVVLQAVSNGLASYLMKSEFVSKFGLVANGVNVTLDLPYWDNNIVANALPTTTQDPNESDMAYVTKAFTRPDDLNYVAKGGSGHDTVQNRTTMVSSITKATANGAFSVQTGVARPNASVYEFLGAGDAGANGAPSSSCLIAAGIGFCYMTQLGRYAVAKKRSINDYRMIQAIDIPKLGSDGSQTPIIGTKLFLNLDTPDEDFACELAHSAKRTCFLHSTLQSSLRCKITVAS